MLRTRREKSDVGRREGDEGRHTACHVDTSVAVRKAPQEGQVGQASRRGARLGDNQAESTQQRGRTCAPRLLGDGVCSGTREGRGADAIRQETGLRVGDTGPKGIITTLRFPASHGKSSACWSGGVNFSDLHLKSLEEAGRPA